MIKPIYAIIDAQGKICTHKGRCLVYRTLKGAKDRLNKETMVHPFQVEIQKLHIVKFEAVEKNSERT